MELTFSTFEPGAKAAVADTEFEVRYANSPDVTLRLPDYTAFSASVGITGLDPDPAERGYPGRFALDDSGPARIPFLIDGWQLWGQSVRRPDSHPGGSGLLLALWTWDSRNDPSNGTLEDWEWGSLMPHRRAVLSIRQTWLGGGDDEAAAFLATMATGVGVRWALDRWWPPCPNTDTDVDGICGCGEEHWAP